MDGIEIMPSIIQRIRKESYAGQNLLKYETKRYGKEYISRIMIPLTAEEFSDFSFYQKGLVWSKYPYRGAIIRIGQNVWEDPSFSTFYSEARALGKILGGYWFYDDRASPEAQASVLIQAMRDKRFEMEIFIDYERKYGGAYWGLKNVKRMIELIETAGVKCKAIGVYTGYYFWTENTAFDKSYYPFFESRPLWIAWYADASLVKIPAPWTDWTHWQYGTPAVDWASTIEIDMNKHNGSLDKYFQIGEPPMQENKYMIVDALVSSLNVRSSPEHLGTANDLGDFNLRAGDIIHAVENVITAGVLYHRFDALYRGGVRTPLVTSPTGQHWSAEAPSVTSTTKWLKDTVFIPAEKNIQIKLSFDDSDNLMSVNVDGSEWRKQ